MHWVLLAGFIAAHVVAYIVVFRYLRIFAAERTILFILASLSQWFLPPSLRVSPAAVLIAPRRAGFSLFNTSTAPLSSNCGRWPREAIPCRFCCGSRAKREFFQASRLAECSVDVSLNRQRIAAQESAMGVGWVLPAMPLIRWMSRP